MDSIGTQSWAHKFRPELEVRDSCLTPLWPFLFAVQDADDLDLRGPRTHTINDDERRRRYDKLASAAPPPSPARLGIFAQQHVGAVPDGARHGERALGAFLFDVIEIAVKIGERLIEPEHRDAQEFVPSSSYRRANLAGVPNLAKSVVRDAPTVLAVSRGLIVSSAHKASAKRHTLAS